MKYALIACKDKQLKYKSDGHDIDFIKVLVVGILKKKLVLRISVAVSIVLEQ